MTISQQWTIPFLTLIFFLNFIPTAQAKPTKDNLNKNDSLEYHHIFDVNSEGNEVDKKPGDGLCQTDKGTCSLKAALDEAVALNKFNKRILIRVLVDKIKWQDLTFNHSLQSKNSNQPEFKNKGLWHFEKTWLTIRGYGSQPAKNLKPVWVIQNPKRIFSISKTYFSLENFNLQIQAQAEVKNNDEELIYAENIHMLSFHNVHASRSQKEGFFRFLTIKNDEKYFDPLADYDAPPGPSLIVEFSSFDSFGLNSQTLKKKLQEAGHGSINSFVHSYLFFDTPEKPSKYELKEHAEVFDLSYQNTQKLGGTFKLHNIKSVFRSSRITNSSSDFGGAIYSYDGSLELIESALTNNQALQKGGALLLEGSLKTNVHLYFYDLEIEKSEIKNNQAHVGQAIFFKNIGGIKVVKNTLSSKQNIVGQNIQKISFKESTFQKKSTPVLTIKDFREISFDNIKAFNNTSMLVSLLNGQKVTIDQSQFFNNGDENDEKMYSTAALVLRTKNVKEIKINQSEFLRNKNYFHDWRVAGVILLEQFDLLKVTKSNFLNNSSDGNGGVFYLSGGEKVFINQSKFKGNQAPSADLVADCAAPYRTGWGGAISGSAKNFQIIESEFIANQATSQGGALSIGFDKLHISRSQFKNNVAYGGGGAINGSGDEVFIDQSQFIKNKVPSSEAPGAHAGGAIQYSSIKKMTIQKSLFESNFAIYGAILGSDSWSSGPGELNILDSNINNNQAQKNGAPFSPEDIQVLKIKNSQINNNKAGNGDHFISKFFPEQLQNIQNTKIDNVLIGNSLKKLP